MEDIEDGVLLDPRCTCVPTERRHVSMDRYTRGPIHVSMHTFCVLIRGGHRVGAWDAENVPVLQHKAVEFGGVKSPLASTGYFCIMWGPCVHA